ncbi:MAG: hypothetical protein Fues2KO_45690 [Fuerstiella sp.]
MNVGNLFGGGRVRDRRPPGVLKSRVSVVKRSPDRFTQPTEGLPFPPAMETCGLRAGRAERPGQDGVLSTIDWT